jgi:hypothetical protein
MVQRLRGGLDDGTGSGEVDDGAGSREIFGWRLWQPDNVSESLRGVGFANNTQRFIYRGTTVGMGISDVIGAVARKNHSSDPYIYSAIMMYHTQIIILYAPNYFLYVIYYV